MVVIKVVMIAWVVLVKAAAAAVAAAIRVKVEVIRVAEAIRTSMMTAAGQVRSGGVAAATTEAADVDTTYNTICLGT